jgi:hypothetical protein
MTPKLDRAKARWLRYVLEGWLTKTELDTFGSLDAQRAWSVSNHTACHYLAELARVRFVRLVGESGSGRRRVWSLT